MNPRRKAALFPRRLVRLFVYGGYYSIKRLGLRQYVHFVFAALLSVPRALLLRRDQLPAGMSVTFYMVHYVLSKLMSRRLRIRFDGYSFLVDCRYADCVLGSANTFATLIELYILNVYFRFHPMDFGQTAAVVDLGGTKGLFSLLAASFAEKVIWVEADTDERYRDVLKHNMALNGLDNCVLENVFVGTGGADWSTRSVPVKRLERIMEENSLDVVDLLKVDIEGSEFGLFRDLECLDAIQRITIEVHSEHGDVDEIIAKLKAHGFAVMTWGRTRPQFYLYAVNRRLDPTAGFRKPFPWDHLVEIC